ncbi:hypothetical protein DAPPUDRAFT_109731 [Daphnia pulex]|uniref:Uncharacterized protein n=1 Tax=Daphnia pulex TaxID=6669 RepID=E9H411_DAPPU|nr:hypothetical protein DAPPUDRAFT_109731 [Daphnia pulex]|eukprot:EFX73519.1 hypothetical protein DAPPUDRAFT_109731 [Daphnia pulex]
MEIITNNNSDKHVSPIEIWNGRKSADQLSIDYEATEVFLNLLEENWETLCDTKTGKKIIWNIIANGLEEAGFAVRGSEKAKHARTSGSNNHSYKPPFVSDSLEKTQNPAKFQPNDEITFNNENGEKQDVNQALSEKLEKS